MSEPELHTTTSVDHVALYERLVGEHDTLIHSFPADARRKPDAAAPVRIGAALSRLIYGARRITARMPGGARLPFRPSATVTNAEALALVARVGRALSAFKQYYQEWDDDAGDEYEDGPEGDFVWRTFD